MIAAIFTKEADIDAGVNFAISASLLMARVNQSRIPNAQQAYRVCLTCFEHVGLLYCLSSTTTKEVANLLA